VLATAEVSDTSTVSHVNGSRTNFSSAASLLEAHESKQIQLWPTSTALRAAFFFLVLCISSIEFVKLNNCNWADHIAVASLV